MLSAVILHDCPFKCQNNNSRFEFAQTGVFLVLQKGLKDYLARNPFCYRAL